LLTWALGLNDRTGSGIPDTLDAESPA